MPWRSGLYSAPLMNRVAVGRIGAKDSPRKLTVMTVSLSPDPSPARGRGDS
jgi:hypothetical protein